jgi:hypothetical protein
MLELQFETYQFLFFIKNSHLASMTIGKRKLMLSREIVDRPYDKKFEDTKWSNQNP